MSHPKVAIVTGASAGIGEATAIEFAKLGYRVVITGRNQERLDRTLDSMINESPDRSRANFLIIRAEFEIQAQVEPIVDQAVKHFGRLDILVNNAGYCGMKRDLSHSDFFEDFQKILQVNLMAATRLAQLAMPHICATKGVIINVSSIADRVAMPNISYSVSKAGLTMLTKTLANALDGTGVRVLCVSPGPIKTNFAEGIEKFGSMTSLQRAGEAIEVANTIVFLSSDKASYIHGSVIDVDGGCHTKFGCIFRRDQFNCE